MIPKNNFSGRARDTGLAMVLIILLVAYLGEKPQLVPVAIVLLVMVMTWPNVFRPLSRVWFGLSRLLGTVMSKVILTVIFFGIVTPVGLIRRMTGADPMRLKQWKDGSHSVLKTRNKSIEAMDLEHPY